MKNENRIERVKEIYMKYFPQLRQLEDNNRVFFDNVSRLAVPPEIKPSIYTLWWMRYMRIRDECIK